MNQKNISKMKSKNLILIIFLGVYGGMAFAQLGDYLQLAAENNPALKSKYAEFESAAHYVSTQNGMPDPTLSFGYFVSPIETKTGPQQARLSVMQMFPWFGTLNAHERRDTLMVKAKYQEFINAKNVLNFQVKSSYYPLYEWREKVELQKEHIVLLEGLKELATSKYKNGLISLVDVIRIDLVLDQARVDLELLVDQSEPLLIKFNRLVGLPDTQGVNLPDTLYVKEVEIKTIPDFTKNPSLLAMDFESQSAQMEVKSMQKKGAPSIGVGLDYVFIGEAENSVTNSGKDAIMPMVSLSLPIYRKKYDGAISRAEFNEVRISSSKQDLENQLNTEFQNTLYEAKRSYKMYTLLHSQMDHTKVASSILVGSFQNSNSDLDEVLRMEELSIQIRNKKLKTITDYHIATARLDYLTGSE